MFLKRPPAFIFVYHVYEHVELAVVVTFVVCQWPCLWLLTLRCEEKPKAAFTRDATGSVTVARHAAARLAARQLRLHGRQLSRATLAYNPCIGSSEVGVLQEKCSRQPVPRGNYKFKLKMPPGLAAVARLLRAACRRVNAPVVFLCFYICGAAVALPVASRVNAA